ncbi:MAG: ABC transporter substrate-binding protein [Actinomycetota bacterium]|nr:ABC transporter substrate-binding protein [Actinomycetota bacterium]
MQFVRSVGVVAVGLMMVATACSSSAKNVASPTTGSPGAGGSSGGRTYALGLMGDFTGAASADSKDMPLAAKARIGLAATQGYNLKLYTADTQSTPAGALTAAQTLVEQDHVFAVIAISDLTFGAVSYLSSHGIPVLGASFDGSEWNTNRNMFSVFGFADYSKAETSIGQFFKRVGATTVGGIGYQIIPSSADAVKAVAPSAQAAGLKVGYINSQFPLGSTNVGPVVLALKQSGVDGVAMEIEQNSGFAIVAGMRQQGAPLKAAVYGAGYGSDLLEAGPSALQQAQDGYFQMLYEPVEMHTKATENFQSALKKYADYTQVPGLNEYVAYLSVDLFVTALQRAGANPTQASIINTLLGITNYDGAGLWGGHTLSMAMSDRGTGGAGAGNCIWFPQYKGNRFVVAANVNPVCGTVLPG